MDKLRRTPNYDVAAPGTTAKELRNGALCFRQEAMRLLGSVFPRSVWLDFSLSCALVQ